MAGLVAAVNLVLWLVLHFLLHRAPQLGTASSLSPAAALLSDGASFLFTAVAALIMSRIEHRKWGEYGLPVRFAFRKHFWLGTLVGFLAISTSLLAIFAFHGFHLAGLAIHGKTMLTATAAWTAAFVIVGLGEEFAFRGYLQFTLTTGMGFWPAALLLSAVIRSRARWQSWREQVRIAVGSLLRCCCSVYFCAAPATSGWAVGFHAGWDWGQTFFYGVADSGLAPYHNLFNSSFSGPTWLTGGSVGPEASIFTPLTLLIVGIVFSRIYRDIRYHPLGK